MKVSLRKPVSLVKNLRKADARVQLFEAELGRMYRRALSAAESSGGVSLRRPELTDASV